MKELGELQLEHAWRYFTIHATQRMSVFNFYIVLMALMTTSLVQTFTKDFSLPASGITLGLSQALVSLVFWRLDRRTRFLIRLGEDALKEMERLHFMSAHVASASAIFNRESDASCASSEHFSSYTQLLQIVHFLFFNIGLFGAVASALSLR